MCALFALLMIVFGGWFGWSAVSTPTVQRVEPLAVATVEAPQIVACATQSPAKDIAESLAYVGDTFADPAVWTSEGSFGDSKTITMWSSDSLNALAYLEVLHYDCGVTQEQIDAYFSEAGFATIFSTYASYEQVAVCEADGVALYEFDATTTFDMDVHILYWVEQVSPTRVVGLDLVFPVTRADEQQQYAEQLFPNLTSCGGEG